MDNRSGNIHFFLLREYTKKVAVRLIRTRIGDVCLVFRRFI